MPQPQGSKKFVGIVTKKGNALFIQSCNKRDRSAAYPLNLNNSNGAKEGDVVLAEREPQAKVAQILGQKTSPKIFSLISLYEQGLSEVFSQAALKQAKSSAVPDLKGREDLRDIPLVTIDGPDARDFDDAVFAEKTAGGGYHMIVAIADVSYYVRPGDDIDREALKRGNSTYFPDMVVPMIPEDLSNGLCSLKPNEDRACIAFHMWINKDGEMTDYKPVRGLMRSTARLTYEQVQAAKDGQTDATTAPLMDKVINPLYAAYEVLEAAREKRGAIEMDAPELKFQLDDRGKAAKVFEVARPDSARVIEEFMIQANVAAATALEAKSAPCVYRVHDLPPNADAYAGRIDALRENLGVFGITLPPGDVTGPLFFKDAIEKAGKLPNGPAILSTIMRTLAKAQYSTRNIGHFGLALLRYAHFTSPIRRYADLLVHRSLIEAYGLGAGALDAEQKSGLEKMTIAINFAEIDSVKAERAANDRFAADYLSARIGEQFKGRITGVIGGGVFVRLDGVGCEGLVPVRTLPGDYYTFDDKTKTLTGKRNGLVFKPGDEMTIRVKEADGLTGSVILEPVNDNKAPPPAKDFNRKSAKKPREQQRQNRNRVRGPG